jgi:hypothetical protein
LHCLTGTTVRKILSIQLASKKRISSSLSSQDSTVDQI